MRPGRHCLSELPSSRSFIEAPSPVVLGPMAHPPATSSPMDDGPRDDGDGATMATFPHGRAAFETVVVRVAMKTREPTVHANVVGPPEVGQAVRAPCCAEWLPVRAELTDAESPLPTEGGVAGSGRSPHTLAALSAPARNAPPRLGLRRRSRKDRSRPAGRCPTAPGRRAANRGRLRHRRCARSDDRDRRRA